MTRRTIHAAPHLCAVGLLTHRAEDFGPATEVTRRVRRPAAQSGAIALAALGLVLLAALPAPAAPADAEQAAIDALKNSQSPADKGAACRTLRTVGTAKAVPALAPLLEDKVLAHWARWALEPMPFPEAGAALRDALPKTAGALRIGIVNSLGERRERTAVAALAPLAQDADAPTASAAGVALGKIGGKEAVDALRAAKAKAPAAAELGLDDGLLACAEQFRAAGDKQAAALIYRELYQAQGFDHIHVAAYRGLVLVSDDPTALVVKGLQSSDRAAVKASIQLARDVKGDAATKELAALIAKLQPPVQVALVDALRQRGDAAAAPAIVAVLASPAPEVRLAALEALSILGDASTASALAEAAAKATGAEQDQAREALNLLKDPKTRDVLVAQLAKAPPAVQAEIVRALGFRLETQAVPDLLKMAGEGDDAARIVAFKSLAMLADGRAAGDLIKLLVAAKSDAERTAAEQALGAACARGEKPQAAVAQVLDAMKGAAVPARVALLHVAGRLGGPAALDALRAGLKDKEPAIQDAALRTMVEFGGLDAAPDLLALAKDAPSLPQKVLALRGCWRIVALAADRPVDERWKIGEAAMAAAQRPEEKKLGLTELAKIPHPGALKLAASMADDEAVRAEAEAAAVQIATALGGAEGKAALGQLAASAKTDAARADAKKALDALDQYSGYVATWLAAGPYRQDGKGCRDLFDVAFPPEQNAADVKWVAAPHPADAALFWQVDLLPIAGAKDSVVYVKTRVWSPKAQKARLDIGSDDGVKLWVNGKMVHANNTMRPLKAAEDKAEADLKEGWNDFHAKITQNEMGCGLCLRVRGPDGSVLDGLKVDTGGGAK